MRALPGFSAAIVLVVVVASSAPRSSATHTQTQAPLRIAMAGFQHPTSITAASMSEKAAAAIERAFGADARTSLVDPSLIRSALSGIAYDGSINMSREEARRLGSAMGCDFFIIGKTDAATRSEREHESHEEALVGLMIVDGRTGELALFDFVNEKSAEMEAAADAAARALAARSPGYIDRISRFLLSRQVIQPSDSERVEDQPEEGSRRATGFTPPEFLNRVKPEYTEAAEKADITATVEATVVFQASGNIGQIEINRWAGFDLDDSARRAISQLKFKPATRDGKPISIRGVVRYNFRRVNQPATPEPRPEEKTPAKPEKDLRQLFKPKYRIPPTEPR
jgi:TonB family protein